MVRSFLLKNKFLFSGATPYVQHLRSSPHLRVRGQGQRRATMTPIPKGYRLLATAPRSPIQYTSSLLGMHFKISEPSLSLPPCRGVAGRAVFDWIWAHFTPAERSASAMTPPRPRSAPSGSRAARPGLVPIPVPAPLGFPRPTSPRPAAAHRGKLSGAAPAEPRRAQQRSKSGELCPAPRANASLRKATGWRAAARRGRTQPQPLRGGSLRAAPPRLAGGTWVPLLRHKQVPAQRPGQEGGEEPRSEKSPSPLLAVGVGGARSTGRGGSAGSTHRYAALAGRSVAGRPRRRAARRETPRRRPEPSAGATAGRGRSPSSVPVSVHTGLRGCGARAATPGEAGCAPPLRAARPWRGGSAPAARAPAAAAPRWAALRRRPRLPPPRCPRPPLPPGGEGGGGSSRGAAPGGARRVRGLSGTGRVAGHHEHGYMHTHKNLSWCSPARVEQGRGRAGTGAGADTGTKAGQG